MSGNSNFLSTFAAIRWANWLDQRRREKEREALLNTIALVEEELAKPRYFGFLIEKDRVGYLEALSKTKTTFKGLNPHDPLNGMVVNGELNPDFILMLEKNFFKVNSENLSVDELNFVRYQVDRDEMIEWLKSQFEELSIDDKYLTEEFRFSQEDLFQNLKINALVFAEKIKNEEVCIVDVRSYLDGVRHQEFCESIPQKFCTSSTECVLNKSLVFVEQKRKEHQEELNRRNKERIEKENRQTLKALFLFLCFILVCVLFYTYMTISRSPEAMQKLQSILSWKPTEKSPAPCDKATSP